MQVKPIAACCGPLLAAPLSEEEADELAGAFRLLADSARLRLISLIAASPAGEVCACDLVGPLGRSQPTVSHHLSALVDAGLLRRERRGKWTWYRVVPERLSVLRDFLNDSPVSPARQGSRQTEAATPRAPMARTADR